MKHFYLLFSIILLKSCIYGQVYTDSAEKIITDFDDNKKSEILVNMAESYVDTDPALAVTYGERAVDILVNLNAEKKLLRVYLIIGNSYKNIKRFDKALNYMQRALAIAEKKYETVNIIFVLNNTAEILVKTNQHKKALGLYKRSLSISGAFPRKELKSEIYERIANIHENIGEFDSAINYYKSAHKIYAEYNQKEKIASTLNRIGIVYKYLGKYNEALQHHYNSLKIYEELEKKEGIARALGNIANIEQSLSKYNNALENYGEVLNILSEVNDIKGVANTHMNFGVVYYYLNKFDTALNYYYKAQKVFDSLDIKLLSSYNLNNIALVYVELKDYSRASEYFSKSLKLVEQLNNKWGIANTLNSIASSKIKLKKYREALKDAKSALAIAAKLDSKGVLIESNLILSEAYAGLNNYKKAHEHYKHYKRLNDSVFNKISSSKIAELKAKHDIQQKEKVIHTLEIEKQLYFKNFLIIASLLLSVIIIVLYNRYRLKSNANKILLVKNQEIEKKNKELESLISALNRKNDELLESESQYKILFEAAGDAIFIHNFNGGIIKVNAKASELLGYEGNVLEQMNINNLTPPDAKEYTKEVFEKLEQTESLIFETEIIRINEELIPVEVSSIVIKFKGGYRILSIVRNNKERKEIEKEIKASLEEKEILLKEVHHRVKNNLQIISSLLFLQSQSIKDEITLSFFQESQNRIRSIALVHERLYQSKKFGHINLNEYIGRLAIDIYRSYGVKPNVVKLIVNIENISISIDKAVPCGLIINELLSNSLKHAFTGEAEGIVEIKVDSSVDGVLTIIIKDNGIGLPEGLNIQTIDSLGLKLVRSLVDQLQGKLEFQTGAGALFKITFTE